MNPAQGTTAITTAAVLCVALLTACASASQSRTVIGPESPPVTAEEGFKVAEVFSGLDGPTQAAFAPDGRLLIAELNGAENDATGRVVAVDLTDPADREILVTGLDKPTGIAIVGDALWIMERRRLSVGPLAAASSRTIVHDELPWNGRSEGTLTVTPTGGLLYNTSGTKRGAQPVQGSGTIFEIADATLGGAPYDEAVIATGFKHAYARVFADGQLFAVEMSDGRFDGSRAQDELVVVVPGDDGGWPVCVGNNRPVAEFGAGQADCGSVRPSHALFAPGSTPTSVSVAPWDADQLVVSLWLSSEIITVPRAERPAEPWEPRVLVRGIESPQYLLAHGDDLLIVDHASGSIFALGPAV